MPAWMLWLLRAQIGIPYLFGGIAKLGPDWLRGEPMRMWLAERTDVPVIGRFFTSEAVVYGFAWGGMLLDLLVVPMLLWRRTRWIALVMLAAFHTLNAELFTIGIFPWLMLAASAIFFPPDALQRAMARIGLRMPTATTGDSPRSGRAPLALAAIFVALQVLVPFRHLLYPGDVNWNEQGHRFSWHMKLRDKEGKITLLVNADAGAWVIRPRRYMARHQAEKLTDAPDMILQLAHHVADEFRRQGHRNVTVHAESAVSLNGREPQAMIDPRVDLAAEPRGLHHAHWILPLEVPLERRASR
jgi:vitamin K-dependent gamma-carboxylase